MDNIIDLTDDNNSNSDSDDIIEILNSPETFKSNPTSQKSPRSSATSAKKTTPKPTKVNAQSHSSPSSPKRLARTRTKPPKKIQERINRALSQRLYVISSTAPPSSSSPSARSFQMLGSTGNVYEISISTTPSCTCPDYLNGNAPCKHIIYVLCKALGLTRDDPRVWQKALLEVELEDVLNSKVRKTAMASKSVIDAVSGKTSSRRDCETPSPDTSGDCAICFDSLGSEKVETCLTCKGCIHAECMKKWLAR